MAIEILPLTESDTLAFVKLHFAAFAPIFIPTLFNSPPSEASYLRLAAQRIKAHSKPTAHIFKAVDTTTDSMVGAAVWYVYPEGRSVDDMNSLPFGDASSYVPEQNADAWIALQRRFAEVYSERVGTMPCVDLSVLVVRPEWQGKGVGTMLMEWGIAEADRLGVIAYVESSSAGEPLYRKFGFEGVGRVNWEVGKSQSSAFDVDLIMIRQPAKQEESKDQGEELASY